MTMMTRMRGGCGTVVHRAVRRGPTRVLMFGAPADTKSASRERPNVDGHGGQRYRDNMPANTAHTGQGATLVHSTDFRRDRDFALGASIHTFTPIAAHAP